MWLLMVILWLYFSFKCPNIKRTRWTAGSGTNPAKTWHACQHLVQRDLTTLPVGADGPTQWAMLGQGLHSSPQRLCFPAKPAFPIEDFDVGGVLEGQVKGRGRGGHNGPALLPHPCTSYSKWPHWCCCCCVALYRGPQRSQSQGAGTQQSLDTCQQMRTNWLRSGQLLLRSTRCFHFFPSASNLAWAKRRNYGSGALWMVPSKKNYLFICLFIFSLCQINFHFFPPSSPLFQSTLLISFWLQLVMRGTII